jgi:quercetin 2,3-dioxygenase
LAELAIPPTTKTSTRFCYFYQGDDLYLNSEKILSKHLVELKPDEQIHLEAGSSETRILWLEGEPIGAPVAMRGPFVLNSNEELDAAFKRYRETQFGEWSWPNSAPVFTRDTPRFATYKGGEYKEFPEDI